MFGWLKNRPQTPNGTPVHGWIAKNAFNMALKLGDLMRKHPHAILDTARLPLPKPAMKLALRIAWKRAPNDETRRFAETAYLHLSNFQDGAGDRPIDATLGEDGDPRPAREILETWLPWAARSGTEAITLAAELKEFTRRQKPRHPAR
jgi:hypothetical protein